MCNYRNAINFYALKIYCLYIESQVIIFCAEYYIQDKNWDIQNCVMCERLSLQSWNFFKVLYSPLYHGLDFIYLHTQINTWRTPFQFSLIQNHLKLCWVTIRRVLYLHISCFRIERKCRCLAVLSYKEIVLIALVFGKRTPLYILCSEY